MKILSNAVPTVYTVTKVNPKEHRGTWTRSLVLTSETGVEGLSIRTANLVAHFLKYYIQPTLIQGAIARLSNLSSIK